MNTSYPDEPDVSAGEASGETTGEDVTAELARLRDSIDNIDAAVVHMLAERFKCTQQVGHLKARHQLPPRTPAARPARSPACASSPRTRNSTRRSRRNC